MMSEETKGANKSLYIADGLISMANCKSEIETDKSKSYDIYLRAWEAVKKAKADNS